LIKWWPTAARTATLQNASGTLAWLDVGQVWETGLQDYDTSSFQLHAHSTDNVPADDSTPDQWTRTGPATNWQALNAKDDVTSYISEAGVGGTKTCKVVLTSAVASTLTSVTAVMRARVIGTPG